MYKMIMTFLVGMILTGAISVVLFSLPSTMGQSDGSSLMEMLPDLPEIYAKALSEPVRAVGDEIQDEELSQFYQELVQECVVDNPSSATTEDESSGLAALLPDIKKINRTALLLPILKAGEDIQDKEIAKFYYQFLKDVGWEIELD